ncbi:MAG TPA: TetR/AcrR family transcriptional regulator [Propionibacteriaceae bacterium]|nr:TetR/AcrR family transcriptional regulator [Propionibacteriaceae bacterium]
MIGSGKSPSPRKAELLERSYRYVLQHGLIDMSLRPLAEAIGSSPRVLLFLFGSKDGLVRELLTRAREAELAMLKTVAEQRHTDLADAAAWLWQWLSDAQHRDLLYLWVEAYGRSLTTSQGPWGGFAESTVRDWLQLLQEHQPEVFRSTAAGAQQRTRILATLRGALLDLLATGETARVTAAVEDELEALRSTSTNH